MKHLLNTFFKHKKTYFNAFFATLLTWPLLQLPQITHTPRVTVIFVIDQFAYHYIPKLHTYFQDGLKTLIDHGVLYTNAYFPHGMPSTATGHTGLSTGTYAKDHGIVGNRWFTATGENVLSDEDTAENAAVFSSDGLYNKGKSARNIMADGLSDQFVLANGPEKPRYAYSVSIKSRAAIATAARLGKAFWFDNKTGQFTSSKAYMNELPAWLRTFNSEFKSRDITSLIWNLRYQKTDNAYHFANPLTYQFVENKESMVDKSIDTIFKKYESCGEPELHYELFSRTPYANQLVCDLALTCLKQHITKDSNDNVLLWVCISSTDKAGHIFGPDSLELIDMYYHLDKQLGDFMTTVQNMAGKENVMFALGADHGVIPVAELLQNKGLDLARRFSPESIIPKLNQHLQQKFSINKLIVGHKTPQYYLNMDIFNKLTQAQQQAIIKEIKKFLSRYSAIKNVWTYDELMQASYQPTQIENFFKQQLFAGRSGYISIQTYPYTMDSKWIAGTDHRSPYAYDTHVPLAIYWPGMYENKRIGTHVWMLQLANTLARILDIQHPSASTFNVLPGLFNDPINN